MRIKYDIDTDSKYIYLKEGKVKKTKPFNEWLILDYDEQDDIVGIEILDASINCPVFSFDNGMLITDFESNFTLGSFQQSEDNNISRRSGNHEPSILPVRVLTVSN